MEQTIETINVQVRKNKQNGWLELFYIEYDANLGKLYTCFSFQEGHNEWSNNYRLNICKPVSENEAKEFAQKVENWYNSFSDRYKFKLVVVKKLKLN